MKNKFLVTLLKSIPENLVIEIELPNTPENCVDDREHWLRHVQAELEIIELHAEYSEPYEGDEDTEPETEMTVKELLEFLLNFDADLEVKILHPYGEYFDVESVGVQARTLIITGKTV
ncbi:hypothetical protein Ava_D0048 [Trichormus variabilis ATCC 29413]|uniref:Uncharacterized protein n=2 Tax=Anabaena variabilis TaxID=264691 RepID=Q3M2S3_TRIV2|nr:hypothetical protein [Trichormus variabilis]ABA24713.1 hypothetical protein Ava_D0048 [Trichormus variabilis ATCC 29413]MBC1217695.1 hypothetical protein [Trichormus variabilis ARAD]MBC1259025.1 hypothetical protein [Trichormus variabilis V5]MBC1301281.1 hypothetical protein [Trichormus variabilis N2B]MBC1324518.1 hypothetical protein [Trichormus variabilis 9RC]